MGQFRVQKSMGGEGENHTGPEGEGNATEGDNHRLMSKSDLCLLLWVQSIFGIKDKNNQLIFSSAWVSWDGS